MVRPEDVVEKEAKLVGVGHVLVQAAQGDPEDVAPVEEVCQSLVLNKKKVSNPLAAIRGEKKAAFSPELGICSLRFCSVVRKVTSIPFSP